MEYFLCTYSERIYKKIPVRYNHDRSWIDDVVERVFIAGLLKTHGQNHHQ